MAVSLSILDLAPVGEGQSPVDALARTVNLARLGERLGYTRYWVAEHHGMPGIASSSPEILMGHVASATERIRVGSGGIMLPNHAPLRIAEAFQTLAALHPGRVDLGIGRAPGTDPVTSQALRPFDSELFPQQLAELMALSRGDFPVDHPFHKVRVIPDGVPLPPIWLLGSSGASARMAGTLGLGYGFASHFSPTPAAPALDAYREAFTPSADFAEPHVILGAAVVCAESAEQADYLASSMDLSWVRLQRGEFAPLPTPESAKAYEYTPGEQAVVRNRRALQVVGAPEQVATRLRRIADETGANELMITTMVHDPAARERSYELVAEAFAATT